MSASSQELARIQTIRAQLAARVAGLREEFQNLEEALRGAIQERAATGPVVSRVKVIPNLDQVLAAIPTPRAELGAAGLLAQYGTTGFRERSYDQVVPVTAPNEIDQNGSYYDASGVYDGWILNPSIDTKIDFDKAPSQNTPFISANSRMMFAVRKSRVYYLAQNPGTVGVMQIWLLRYNPVT